MCVPVCSEGYTLNTTDNICYQCNTNCKICNSTIGWYHGCNLCKIGYWLYDGDGLCYEICPIGYTFDYTSNTSTAGGKCITC